MVLANAARGALRAAHDIESSFPARVGGTCRPLLESRLARDRTRDCEQVCACFLGWTLRARRGPHAHTRRVAWPLLSDERGTCVEAAIGAFRLRSARYLVE